ncbi:MAG: sulfate transporter subunit, partial [Verrucomicrobiaceae bacterium]
MKTKLIFSAAALTAIVSLASCGKKEAAGSGSTISLLNVSYDPTREFYVDVNKSFSAKWKKAHGQTLTINQS